VLARLEVASDEGWALKLRVSDGTELHGIVGLPEDRSTVDVLTDQTVVKLHIGAPAHVSITGPNGALSFYSGVVEIKPDGRVLLELPRVVRVVDSRGLDRQALGEADNVRVVVPLGQLDGVFEVVELSSQGLSFRVPTSVHHLAKDQRVKVRLKVPGSRSLRMTVTVRNLRWDPQVAGSRLVGARVEAGPEDLAQYVAEALGRGGQAT
jgi:hypothetical protein